MLLNLDMDVGKELRSWRRGEGLSQAKLGQRIGVDGQTISNLENGHTQGLKLTNAKKLSDLTGIPVERLAEPERRKQNESDNGRVGNGAGRIGG